MAERIETIACRLLRPREVRRSARPRVERQSASGHSEAVRQREAIGEAGLLQRCGVTLAQLGEDRRIAQADAE
jgi:hypothetical protein